MTIPASWPLLAGALLYLWQCSVYWGADRHAMAVSFLAYAIANVALYMDAPK